MTTQHETQIQKYIEYFKIKLAEIRALSTKSQGLFQHILYLGILDALSKCVYPHKGNHDRLTGLVLRFSGWPHAKRISLIHLIQLLRKVPDPEFDSLREFAKHELESMGFPLGNLPTLDKDPEYELVRSKWPKQVPLEVIRGIHLESLQHINLLYTFRNSIVHEMRTLGKGFDLADKSEPYYLNMLNIESEEINYESIELVYPSKFLEGLCTSCIEGVRQHLLQNDLNPYDYYDFGSYWISDLN